MGQSLPDTCQALVRYIAIGKNLSGKRLATQENSAIMRPRSPREDGQQVQSTKGALAQLQNFPTAEPRATTGQHTVKEQTDGSSFPEKHRSQTTCQAGAALNRQNTCTFRHTHTHTHTEKNLKETNQPLLLLISGCWDYV